MSLYLYYCRRWQISRSVVCLIWPAVTHEGHGERGPPTSAVCRASFVQCRGCGFPVGDRSAVGAVTSGLAQRSAVGALLGDVRFHR